MLTNMTGDQFQKYGGIVILIVILGGFAWLIWSGRGGAEPDAMYPPPDLTQLEGTGRLQFVNGYANW